MASTIIIPHKSCIDFNTFQLNCLLNKRYKKTAPAGNTNPTGPFASIANPQHKYIKKKYCFLAVLNPPKNKIKKWCGRRPGKDQEWPGETGKSYEEMLIKRGWPTRPPGHRHFSS